MEAVILTSPWAGRPKIGEDRVSKAVMRNSGRFFMDMAELAVVLQKYKIIESSCNYVVKT